MLWATIIGAAFGVFLAHRRGGNNFDKAQYGVVMGLIFALVTLFIGIALGRLI